MYALMVFAAEGQETAFVMFGCALFAALLFFYVFYQPGDVEAGEEKTRLMYLLERKEATYENLRDLSFEYKAGKLSEADYSVQQATLEDEAAAILAEMESIEKARRGAAWDAASGRSGKRRAGVKIRRDVHVALKGHSFSCAVNGFPKLGASALEGGQTVRIPSAAKAECALHQRKARLKPRPFKTVVGPATFKTTCINLVTCVWLGVCMFALSSFAAAQNITGTVTNATTGKPSAGDVVTLLSLSQGMQEVANTKSDAQGHFSFAAPAGDGEPRMVRVTHDGVNYFPQSGPLIPGTTTAELTVYDSAKKVDGLSQTVEVDRYQSDGKQLEAITLYAIRNQSKPPRTVADDKRTFEFVLPDGAELESAQAKGPGGQPIAVEAAPGPQKNRYAFNYPLRPGETQFQVSFYMPYNGAAAISPKPVGEVQHFVVMTPKGMTFTPKNAQQFHSMPDETGAGIMVATNVKPGQDLSFRIAGAGAFQEGAQPTGRGDASGGGAMGGGSPAAANDNRPGGGLGAPIDAPDPLHDYRAYILGAFALVLVMGGAYVVSKSNVRPRPATAAAGAPGRDVVDAGEAGAGFADFEERPVRDRNVVLLEAMKEELFQLEIDRQQGKVSAEEYSKAKSALDETIRRALARRFPIHSATTQKQ